MKTHKDLDVYKNAIDFVSEVYKLTSHFPKDEIYGLTSQMRRAAVSIPSNIAEGSARNHSKEFKQFLYISLGSASELDTLLFIALNLGLINKETQNDLLNKLTISKMLQGLIKSLNA